MNDSVSIRSNDGYRFNISFLIQLRVFGQGWSGHGRHQFNAKKKKNVRYPIGMLSTYCVMRFLNMTHSAGIKVHTRLLLEFGWLT